MLPLFCKVCEFPQEIKQNLSAYDAQYRIETMISKKSRRHYFTFKRT